MNFINAGVIGLGFIGPQAFIDAICRAPDARLAAVCDADENAAHAAAERYHVEKVYTDWRQMIADPDIQVVHNCTPHFLHEAINEAALLAGKREFMPKNRWPKVPQVQDGWRSVWPGSTPWRWD